MKQSKLGDIKTPADSGPPPRTFTTLSLADLGGWKSVHILYITIRPIDSPKLSNSVQNIWPGRFVILDGMHQVSPPWKLVGQF